MFGTTPNSPPSVTPTKRESQKNASVAPKAQLQSLVTFLEDHLFVRTSDLIARVIVITKNTSGKMNWVTLDPVYHSILVKAAVAAAKANSLNHSVASIKEALFIFLLDHVNRKQQANFFVSQELEVENKTQKAN
ncbi:hypothetical protein EI94DRAFT_1710187 [Lactarius quietus]|nr:hypothetical protein EI94DRAFT_1710187 [Lactarius quietus]